jgi:Cyclic nucleotide-binding domain
MLRVISTPSSQRGSSTHFGTVCAEPPIQAAPPAANPIINHVLSLMIVIRCLSSGGVMQVIASSRNIKSKRQFTQRRAFDVRAFLDSAGVARRVVEYRRSQKIYSQGDPATKVMYVQKGGVKLSVVNEVGKEAVLTILGPGDFLGEGAWQVSLFEWGQRSRLHPRVYS